MTGAYDITGPDSAGTSADDSAAAGVEFSPAIDHTVRGCAALEWTVVTALGTVVVREAVGVVSSGGEIVEYLGSSVFDEHDAVGVMIGAAEWVKTSGFECACFGDAAAVSVLSGPYSNGHLSAWYASS